MEVAVASGDATLPKVQRSLGRVGSPEPTVKKSRTQVRDFCSLVHAACLGSGSGGSRVGCGVGLVGNQRFGG